VRILVTGAAGQLGSTIAAAWRDRAELLLVTRATLDLADTEAVDAFVVRQRPDVVINTAAYNDVDGAEDHPVEALRVNAFAVRGLSRACADVGAVLVHYGTDFVFAGDATRPYTEDDDPAPQSLYASSKLLGDWFAAEAPRHYVLRVESLFGGTHRRSSVDRIANAILRGQPARVFIDRMVTPSYVTDVAEATWRLLNTGAPAGLYHCVNTGVTSWRELAEEIARQIGVEPQLIPVLVAEVPMKARRPRYAALSNEKLRCAGIVMPSWQDALARYLHTLRGEASGA
jgi:dTDP-4-dehydrorhamnose reductase